MLGDVAFFVALAATSNAMLVRGTVSFVWLPYSIGVLVLLIRALQYYAYVRSVLLYQGENVTRNNRHLPLPTSDIQSALAAALYSVIVTIVTRLDATEPHFTLEGTTSAVIVVHFVYAITSDDRPMLREFVRTYLEHRTDPPAHFVTWSGTQTLRDMTTTLLDEDESDESLVSVHIDDNVPVSDSERQDILHGIKAE